MPSQKQIEANRLNARKSTGPRTPAGKARSSVNALKTGIDAKTQIIRGEIYTVLQELTSEYYDRFRPTTPEQRVLVDTLIDCDWLLRRFRAIETQLWEEALDIYDRSLGRTYSKYCDEFSRLQRRIDTTQRNYRNALHELQHRQAEESQLDPDLDPLSPQAETTKLADGFVPQDLARQPASPSEDSSTLPSRPHCIAMECK